MKKKKDSSECHELKNIQYQTMLLNSKVPEKVDADMVSNIDNFLKEERKANSKKTWGKLGKANKLKKIVEFVDVFSKQQNLSLAKKKELKQYLLTCLHRKKLQRIKDVVYDVNTGKITTIPGLVFNKNRFTLRRSDRKPTTSKCTAHKNK
tara:strand:- start:114 stop:563 length:450 start_codon:yes stop_codon:yes gene_type:complete